MRKLTSPTKLMLASSSFHWLSLWWYYVLLTMYQEIQSFPRKRSNYLDFVIAIMTHLINTPRTAMALITKSAKGLQRPWRDGAFEWVYYWTLSLSLLWLCIPSYSIFLDPLSFVSFSSFIGYIYAIGQILTLGRYFDIQFFPVLAYAISAIVV